MSLPIVFYEEHKKNMRKIWDGIKSIISINKTSKKSIAASKKWKRNSFFVTIAQKIEAKLVHTDKHQSDYLTAPIENTFTLTLTSSKEIVDVLKMLNLDKALGSNNIITKLLKQFSKAISIALDKQSNFLSKREHYQTHSKWQTLSQYSKIKKTTSIVPTTTPYQ